MLGFRDCQGMCQVLEVAKRSLPQLLLARRGDELAMGMDAASPRPRWSCGQ